MPHFFILLLKINLVLVLFATAYYLILRRLTFYTINRVFLVFGIIFATAFPFINLTDFFHRQQNLNQQVAAFVPQLNQEVNALVPSNFIALHWQILSLLFYLGVGLMMLRLAIQFLSLYRMHKKSAPGAVQNYPVRILNEAVGPFSFWQTVYINPTLHQENELSTILAHEQIHVKDWHSLDIILAELSVVFYWFNPGVWLMKKAVKENLEFITDQKILNKGVDKKTYQYSLLDVGNLAPAAAIVNNFNLSDLKKRIKMMNVKRSSRYMLTRYLIVTPVLLLVTLAFTVSKKEFKKQIIPFQQVFDQTFFKAKVNLAVSKPKKTQITKKKNIKPVKVDSANKITLFVRNFFVVADSVSKPALDLVRNVDINAIEKVISQSGHDRATHRIFVMNKDSVSRDGRNVKIENLRIQLKPGVEIPPLDGADDRVIILKGVMRNSSPTDSIAHKNLTYYLNGKQISADEFNKTIKPESIKNVNITKSSTLSSVNIMAVSTKP